MHREEHQFRLDRFRACPWLAGPVRNDASARCLRLVRVRSDRRMTPCRPCPRDRRRIRPGTLHRMPRPSFPHTRPAPMFLHVDIYQRNRQQRLRIAPGTMHAGKGYELVRRNRFRSGVCHSASPRVRKRSHGGSRHFGTRSHSSRRFPPSSDRSRRPSTCAHAP